MMASVIKRATLILGKPSFNSFLSTKNCTKTQVAGLISKALRESDYKRPPPFPYKKKKYGNLDAFFDKTTWRFDENSKIIVVDGPFAVGKAKLTKELAEEFDLHLIPHANLDRLYVNHYGYDLRSKIDEIPQRLKPFETHEFLANPKDERATRLQYQFFLIRFSQYLDALEHILNTGQGIIMNRSVYSDFVFAETFINCGFVAPTFKNYYYKIWDAVHQDLMRPHLIIYLDAPVDAVRQNLKKRNNPVEINSPVYQPDVLKELENMYKFKFLKKISTHAKLLVYDWSEPIETEVIVEDMERLSLENTDPDNKDKMKDWVLPDEWSYNYKRICFSKDRNLLEIWGENIPNFECKEIIYDPADLIKYEEVKSNVPGNKYDPGFNPDMGDNVLFKNPYAFN